MAGTEITRDGHPVRHFPLAVSTTALALAWARQEAAQHGAVVLADREVSPLGRLGRLWTVAPEVTFAAAVVARPVLSAEEGDAAWLLGGLLALQAAEQASERPLAVRWPDSVVDPDTDDEVAMVKADIHLRPGLVSAAVLTLRFDLGRLGVDPHRRDDMLQALLSAVQSWSEPDAGGGALAAAYEPRCSLIGKRLKLKLLPRGETRGTARGIGRHAQLEIASATGMIERISVDAARSLEIVG